MKIGIVNSNILKPINNTGETHLKQNYMTDDGVALGQWLAHQRTLMESGKLEHDREQKLKNLGIYPHRRRNDSWEKQYDTSKSVC